MITPRFITPLTVELLDGGRGASLGLWVVRSRLIFLSAKRGVIAVPRGFLTDLASVPRWPVVFFSVGGMGHAAAVLHDYLYFSGGLTRREADDVFFEALTASGVNRARAWVLWLGVRMGGRAAWGRGVHHG